jgi:hypothetical protein
MVVQITNFCALLTTNALTTNGFPSFLVHGRQTLTFHNLYVPYAPTAIWYLGFRNENTFLSYPFPDNATGALNILMYFEFINHAYNENLEEAVFVCTKM